MNDCNDQEVENIIQECIKVIESTNLGDRARTTYDDSLVEYARKTFITNIKKRFNLIKGNY